MTNGNVKSTPERLCFGAFELQYLCLVAERRNCGKQPNGVRNRRYDSQNDFSLNMHGAMGEYAVAKFLGTKIDHNVGLAGDDKISDLIVGSTKIQVKTNMARGKILYLYFNDKNLFRADVAVLAAIRSATEVELPGWVDRKQFLEIAESRDFGYGPRWCVASDQLQPMPELRKRCTTLD